MDREYGWLYYKFLFLIFIRLFGIVLLTQIKVNYVPFKIKQTLLFFKFEIEKIPCH